MTNSNATPAFTTAEKVASVGKSLGVLRRFVINVPLLRALFYPTVLLSLVAVALPQLFLWLSGMFVQCGAEPECTLHVPLFDVDVPATIGLLCWVAAISFCIRLSSWLIFEVGGEWVMQGFHQKMVHGLRRVRTTYFDENPSGRIINRMVHDYEQLRTSCVIRIGDSVQALLEVISIATMVLIAQPIGGLLIVPTVAVFLYIQWGVSPMLQRLTTIRSIRMGEVIHRETDLIEGARTFLLYGAERALLERLRRAVSRYVQIHFLRVKIEAWGRVLSSAVTSFYSFLSILFVALAVRSGSLSLVMGSAIVTIILRLTPACSWLAWSVSLLIESVGVTKRAFEIVDLPSQEDEEFEAPPIRRDAHLPSSGDLKFIDYSMSYRSDTPVILSGVSFHVPAGSHVGVIGRTGSGKTSLFQSLFRMVHVQHGDITFGDTSLLSASLDSVRRLFGVVPQDPYLFSGTIRSNLDPDGVSNDERLHRALQAVGIYLPLDLHVTEGGKNLSVGERQLICLSRVIVYDRPVVLLDEPTSSVDNVTDARIQAALRSAFGERTVIAIAHRLETLVNYDLIVELRDGCIARCGSPADMLPQLSQQDLV